MRDRDVPVPGAARRRPDQPQRPANQALHRPDLAVGRTDHPSLAPDPRRVHLNTATPCPSDPKPQPPQVEPAPTRHDSRAHSQPRSRNHYTASTLDATKPSLKSARKIEARSVENLSLIHISE